jgi:hypothetical protein
MVKLLIKLNAGEYPTNMLHLLTSISAHAGIIKSLAFLRVHKIGSNRRVLIGSCLLEA